MQCTVFSVRQRNARRLSSKTSPMDPDLKARGFGTGEFPFDHGVTVRDESLLPAVFVVVLFLRPFKTSSVTVF